MRGETKVVQGFTEDPKKLLHSFCLDRDLSPVLLFARNNVKGGTDSVLTPKKSRPFAWGVGNKSIVYSIVVAT